MNTANVMQMLAALAATLALVLLLAALVRRFGQGSLLPKEGPLSVRASLPFSGRERLLLVVVNERELLLGVSPAGISLLGDVTPTSAMGCPSAGAAVPNVREAG